MKVTIMLADHAQVVGGKLFISGGGWSMTGPDPCPFAIALDVKVPWDVAHRRHPFALELLDADGNAVTPDGLPNPLRIDGEFETGKKLGLKEGTAIDAMWAVNFPPQPIPPGRYEWRVWIDGVTEPHWYAAFTVREQAERAA